MMFNVLYRNTSRIRSKINQLRGNWEDYDDLEYDANMLNEFLWYCHNDNIHFVFKNFNLEKIKNYKNYENFQWNLIIEVIEDFVKKYSNNTLDFINE